MTDAEIKKALECCAKETADCENCPANREFVYCQCFDEVKILAVDLINRQEAEIEDLQEKNSNLTSDLTSLQNDLSSAKAEIEMLNKQRVFEINSAFDRGRAVSYMDVTPSKALIERLTADDTPPTDITKSPSASFFFKLAQQRERTERFFQQLKAEIKAEAYKEFAERVKLINSDNLIIWNEQIDNLLKEMESGKV